MPGGQSDVRPPETAAESARIAGAARLRRWPLAAASVLLAACGAALAGIAWFGANPVTLNADQLARADLVVTASSVSHGELLVERDWKHGEALGTIRVPDLPARMRDGRSYIVPLTVGRDDGPAEYRVTPPRGGDDGLPVYPLTPAVARQLERLLARGGGDPPRR